MHLLERDVPRLAELLKERYNQDLISAELTQFHEDFDGFSGSVGKIHSRKLIQFSKVFGCRDIGRLMHYFGGEFGDQENLIHKSEYICAY